jgi:hypothetical protein
MKLFLPNAKVINISADNSPEANNAREKSRPDRSGLSAFPLAAVTTTELELYFEMVTQK